MTGNHYKVQKDYTNQPPDWKMLTKKENSNKTRGTVCTKGTGTFPASPAAFVSHFDTHLTPRWQPRALWEHTRLIHICMQRPRSQSILAADSGFHFGPRAMRFIESCLHGVLLGKPRNFILPVSSDFIVVAPWHAASSSHAADRQACFRPLAGASPEGQVSVAG